MNVKNMKQFSKIMSISIFAAIALIVGALTVKAVGVNLIANPGFETATGDGLMPESWATGGYGNNDRAITYETLPDMTRAGKVTITTYTDGDVKWVFQSVPVEAGALYSFSDRYNSNATTFLFAQYTAADSSLSYEQIASIPSSGGAWMTGRQDFTPPAGTVSVTVFHMLSSVGELMTDDYSLSLLQSASENQFSQGIVSITFDDGWENQYTTAAPKLSALNLPASYYIVSGTISNNEFGYMTTQEVLNLQTAGNEIGAHTINHCNMALLPDIAGCAFAPAGGATTSQHEIEGSKADLSALGAMITTFAYPNGGYTDVVKTEIQNAGLSAARAIDAGFNTRFSDKFALKTQVVDTTVPMPTIKGWIDTAAANKTWLILTFHQVASLQDLQSNNDEGGVTPENFQEIIDYIAATRDGATNPIAVKTLRDVLPLMATATVDPVDPLDTLAPVILLNGNADVSVMVGATYTDAGATASDNVDGNLTSSIVISGSVDTTTAGVYTITYNVTDAAGNHAETVTRTVTVVANSIPVITLNGSSTVSVELNGTYTDAGATATDTEDGDLTSAVVATGSVNTATPDTYTISYNVTDANGGVAVTVTRTVTVSQTGSNGGNGGGGSSGGSGGGGGGGGGSYVPPAVVPVIVPVVAPATPGTVLGSSCGALLTNNISFRNPKNKADDVKKLQAFLNTHMNAKLPVTGYYGSMTLAAVKNFQTKYKSEILTPVKLTKANGNVFTLTRAKINALNCSVN